MDQVRTHPDLDWLTKHGIDPKKYYHTEHISFEGGYPLCRMKINAPVKPSDQGIERLHLDPKHDYIVVDSSMLEGDPMYYIQDLNTKQKSTAQYFDVELDKKKILENKDTQKK